MPEYLLVFRKWAKEGQEDLVRPVEHHADRVPLEAWQELASPVWNYQPKQSGRGDFDMPATDVLERQVGQKPGRRKTPMPHAFNITRKALALWSNEGDVVFSPFMGIGSEGVASLSMGRKFMGTELHLAYYRQAVKNIEEQADQGQQANLFEAVGDRMTCTGTICKLRPRAECRYGCTFAHRKQRRHQPARRNPRPDRTGELDAGDTFALIGD